MLSFAGVNLCVPSTRLALEIEERISMSEVRAFERLYWPGKNRTGWAFPGSQMDRPVKINTLFWPRGASRWAVGWFLASDRQLLAIRQALGTTYASGKLVMTRDDPTGVGAFAKNAKEQISTLLFPLAARPLFQLSQPPSPKAWNGLNLLCLVDDRYWWQYRSTGAIAVTVGTTAWTDLLSSAASALSVTVTNDAVNASYQKPDSTLAVNWENGGLYLDTLAYNVGMRVARGLDGSVKAQLPTTAKTAFDANIALKTYHFGGGKFPLTKDLADMDSVLPGTVVLTFPKALNGYLKGTTVSKSTTLATLALSDFGSRVGNTNTKTFHTTMAALDDGAGSYTNNATLNNLVTQVATDWYRWQYCYHDVTFAGVINWAVEAWSDYVEWTYLKDVVKTRISRGPYNDLTEELQHSDGTVINTAGFWAQITLQQTVIQNGTTTSGSAVITGLSDTTKYAVGWSVSGTGIPANATIVSIDSGTQVTMNLLATVTGSASLTFGGFAFSWREVTPATGGTFTVTSGGRTGTTTVDPGYEANQNPHVSLLTYVWMYLGFNNSGSAKQEYLFRYEKTSVQQAYYQTISNVGVALTQRPILDFEYDSGAGGAASALQIADDSTNHRTKVTVKDAALTQDGVVNLVAQTLGDGDKTFHAGVIINSGVSTGISYVDHNGTPVAASCKVFGGGTNQAFFMCVDSGGKNVGSVGFLGASPVGIGMTVVDTATQSKVTGTMKLSDGGLLYIQSFTTTAFILSFTDSTGLDTLELDIDVSTGHVYFRQLLGGTGNTFIDIMEGNTKFPGVSGTDPVGNVFKGGIITTLGTGTAVKTGDNLDFGTF